MVDSVCVGIRFLGHSCEMGALQLEDELISPLEPGSPANGKSQLRQESSGHQHGSHRLGSLELTRAAGW